MSCRRKEAIVGKRGIGLQPLLLSVLPFRNSDFFKRHLGILIKHLVDVTSQPYELYADALILGDNVGSEVDTDS